MSYKEVSGGICAPRGFAAAGVHCGIRANHNEKYDLALIKAEVRCAAAGVYTTNKVCGAPIKVDRAHLKDGYAQAILVNSGNANTCAANGVALAEACCALVGKALDIPAEDVLPASTGVIGQPMVIDPFARGIPAAAAKLAATGQGSTDAATAIMTTDTHKKEYAIQFELGGKTCTVGAIGKGSGMIAKIDYCKEMMAKAQEKGVKLLLPVDAACVADFPDPIDAPVEVKVVPVTAIPADMEGCDIGPESMKLFAAAVKASKTVVWNGPMGVFENPTLAAGTLAVAKAMAESGATTVIGGGDSAAAVQQMGLGDKMTHISTGGGASLEYLEGKELPGIAVIQNA